MMLTRLANVQFMKKIFLVTVVALAVLVCVASAIVVRNAQYEAVRSRAVGRLGQLHLSLANYQSLKGALPARHSFDASGKPAFSWLVFALPQWDESMLAQLDTTKPWNAPENVEAVNLGETFWDWYCRDGFFPCTLKGDHSIWADDGEPRGKLAELPDSIVLVSVTVDDVHPLQPFAITEAQLKRILFDGGEAQFIDANGTSGQVRLEEGELVFVR